ncbi:MAG: type II toxin-antitoxin system VapC family toxin [Actinomycetota bacterium]|nr:type II toxin-antitoxin system VapC family toxin [Actinomycetota bacterium]
MFIAHESGRGLDEDTLPDEIAVSVITIGELRAGVLAAPDLETRDRRLGTLTQALALQPIPIDEPVAEAWARLRLRLRDSGQRMAVNDSWIAATAMSLGVPVVTQDDHYVDVAELRVLKV